MELQSIRYAAMVSTMTFERAIDVFSTYSNKIGQPKDARETLLTHLDWEEGDYAEFAQDVHIVLVSAGFSKEVTSSVLWLNDHGTNISCIRLKPYSLEGHLLVDVERIIPLPEAESYQIQVREKKLKEQQARRSNFRFSLVGIKPGAQLVSVFDESIRCTVKDDKRVEFRGVEQFLSAAALIVAHEKGHNWPAIAGPQYWEYNGKTLADMRDQNESEEE